MTGRADSATIIVGVGACADDGGITYPPPTLVGRAAGGCPGSEITLLIQCNRADGGKPLVVLVFY